MTDYINLTNDELYEEYDRLGRQVMYYAAAEGNWASETKDRMETEAEYYACQKEIEKRGLKA